MNILSYIDYTDDSFAKTIYLSAINTFALMLIPFLQYRYKFISKFTGDDMGRAADFAAYVLIHIGTFRNYSFIESTYNSKPIELGLFNYLIVLTGLLTLVLGSVLVAFAFRKLGLRGMYFGDHFGFIMNNRIDSFPYNYFENPQYIGCVMMYLGYSLICRSLTGLIMTSFIVLCYQILFRFFEKKQLKMLYN
jgi:phosphatidylethanolamine N-methyltransferase